MKTRVYKIVSNIFDCPLETVSEKTSPDSVENWDSLNHMKLVVSLEEEFDISFTDDEIVDMLNVELILMTLKSKGLHE